VLKNDTGFFTMAGDLAGCVTLKSKLVLGAIIYVYIIENRKNIEKIDSICSII
jgi:hypothetical protein